MLEDTRMGRTTKRELSLPKILCGLWQMSFPPTEPQTSSRLRPCLNLVNQIRRCTPVQRSIALTEISKRQG
jgi:hypothetical protein